MVVATGDLAAATVSMGRWNTIDLVDAAAGLKRLPAESVDCVITSPPYWRTRDYFTKPVDWPDGCHCALGQENDPDEYIAHLAMVFDQVKRVLKPAGSLWINIGDVYARLDSGKQGNLQKSDRSLLPDKCLRLIPAKLALQLIQRGWILRNDIVWHKPNHMPESVKDRLACSWEHLLFFVKSRFYYFDLDAIRIPHETLPDGPLRPAEFRVRAAGRGKGRLPPRGGEVGAFHPHGKNPSDHWSIAPETRSMQAILGGNGSYYHGKPKRHWAIYPEQLCERPILAGSPPGGVVLDPFMGSGTTACVARRLGRRFLGFELNPDYVRLARQRLRQQKRALAEAKQGTEGG